MNHDKKPFLLLFNDTFTLWKEEVKKRQLMKHIYLKEMMLLPQREGSEIKYVLCLLLTTCLVGLLFYQTTSCHIPEDITLHGSRCWNLKSNMINDNSEYIMPGWCKLTFFFLFVVVSKDYPSSIRNKMCLKL